MEYRAFGYIQNGRLPHLAYFPENFKVFNLTKIITKNVIIKSDEYDNNIPQRSIG